LSRAFLSQHHRTKAEFFITEFLLLQLLPVLLSSSVTTEAAPKESIHVKRLSASAISKKKLSYFVIPAEAGIYVSSVWIPGQARNDKTKK